MRRAATSRLLLSLVGCGRAFDETAWKAEAGSARTDYNSARRDMLADLERQLTGANRRRVLDLLGPSEARYDDLCREMPAASDCLIYYAGASGMESLVIIVAFRNDLLMNVRVREL